MTSDFKPEVEKQHQMAKISPSYRKSVSLNQFLVTNLRPEVELMHLLHIRIHCRHKSHQTWCRAPEIIVSV